MVNLFELFSSKANDQKQKPTASAKIHFFRGCRHDGVICVSQHDNSDVVSFTTTMIP